MCWSGMLMEKVLKAECPLLESQKTTSGLSMTSPAWILCSGCSLMTDVCPEEGAFRTRLTLHDHNVLELSKALHDYLAPFE